MAHWLEYKPADTDEPEDFGFDGTFTFTCDCPPTQGCRWTSDCDCEMWSLDIAEDGSWATHTHYVELDEGDEDGEEEVAYPMKAIEGPRCNAYWWFTESDFRDWALPPRKGRQEISVKWVYDYYQFGYAIPAVPGGER